MTDTIKTLKRTSHPNHKVGHQFGHRVKGVQHIVEIVEVIKIENGFTTFRVKIVG